MYVGFFLVEFHMNWEENCGRKSGKQIHAATTIRSLFPFFVSSLNSIIIIIIIKRNLNWIFIWLSEFVQRCFQLFYGITSLLLSLLYTWVVVSHKCTSTESFAWMSTNSHKTSVFFICKLPSNLHTYERHHQKASLFFAFGTAAFMVEFCQSINQFRSFFIIPVHKFKCCIFFFF